MPNPLTRLAVVFFSLFLAKATFAGDSVYLFKEANIKIDIPSTIYHLRPRQEQNGFIIYVFKREPIQDSAERSIIPNVAVVIENVDPKMDVVTYSVTKRGNGAFDVDKMFIHGDGIIDFVNAVGYQGSYTDQNNMKHTVYVVHAINGDKGIQIIMDTTSDTFPSIDPEFRKILKSIRK
ncbi:MAG TPA: hypothetical protein VGS79_21090 [Puia sp.]|nr:hypothetical protein [Puia sp.]